MKILEKRNRITINSESLKDIMLREYDFYKQICNDFVIGNKKYKVCKKVNFQCRTTLHCNGNCLFCIEKDSCKNKEVLTNDYIGKLDISLKELHSIGIYPTVTITGGEPCLNKVKLLSILDTLNKNNISRFNLNTNGILLDEEILSKVQEVKMPYLNVSLHHYDLNKNKELYGGVSISLEQLQFIKKMLGATYYDNTRVRLQCVLVKGYIDSKEEIKNFLDFALSLGFDNVAFRGLSKLKECGINNELHKFCEENSMDIFNIVNSLSEDENFKFNCQNISDHYMYEDWVYKNKLDVHFAYSDMDILNKREEEEIKKNINYAREFVLYEDCSFCGGWNKEIKLIY